ncbi:MAG: bifunctional metallophosphatase/5'-nucleotidase [Candidatus Eremiobacteraeota bacterium]|nr:bifunctional metallophosphatase/5'-nucleotidase [Candidatus Eremiobacteraeota bacterium]
MKNRKKLVFLILLLFVASICGGLFLTTAYAEEHKHDHDHDHEHGDCEGKGKLLVILHTNDVHGQLKSLRDKRMSKDSKVGGSAYLSTLINDLRKKYKGHVLLLDAGDIAQGTPVSNHFKGIPVVDVMNYMKYDVMTIGNHEFDWRQPALKAMIDRAKFPVVCANIVYKKDPSKTIHNVKPYVIKKVGDIKVGILGLCTPYTVTITKKENVKGLLFLNVAKTSKKYIPIMKKEGANIIIALTHLGIEDDIKLAKAVKGIDVIVGGHSHSKLKDPKKVGNTLIVQAKSKGRYLGKLELRYCMGHKRIKSYSEKDVLIPIVNSKLKADEKVLGIIDKYEKEIAPMMRKVVGKTELDLTKATGKDHKDSVLGNLICDAMIDKSGADVSIYNPGGIRAEVYAGDITVENMITVLPFDNWLVTCDLRGKELVEIFEHAASRKGSAQVSGITFEIDYSKPKGKRLSNVKIAGKPIDKNKIYTITTIDFLFTRGDGYDFKAAKNVKYGDHIRDVVTEYVRKKSPLRIKPDKRIKSVGK